MFGLIRFAIFFGVSFFILSISYQNKTLFDRLAENTHPYFTQGKALVSEGIDVGIEKSKNFVKMLFSNSDPKATRIDTVKARASSTMKILKDMEKNADQTEGNEASEQDDEIKVRDSLWSPEAKWRKK